MDEILRKRLFNEHAMMQELSQRSLLVKYEYSGNPPTKYSVTLSCRGLYLTEGDLSRPVFTEHHEFDILLEPAFPFIPPHIIWKTPLFHPNFKVPLVCLGDHWYPASSLRDVCIALCELIQYKKFNTDDPLDPVAADWLLQVLHKGSYPIPVDDRLVFNNEVRGQVQPASALSADPTSNDFTLTPRRSYGQPASDIIRPAPEENATSAGARAPEKIT